MKRAFYITLLLNFFNLYSSFNEQFIRLHDNFVQTIKETDHLINLNQDSFIAALNNQQEGAKKYIHELTSLLFAIKNDDELYFEIRKEIQICKAYIHCLSSHYYHECDIFYKSERTSLEELWNLLFLGSAFGFSITIYYKKIPAF